MFTTFPTDDKPCDTWGAGQTNMITLNKTRAEQRAEQTSLESGVRILDTEPTAAQGKQTDHGIK